MAGLFRYDGSAADLAKAWYVRWPGGFVRSVVFRRDGFRYSWLPSLAVIVGRMATKFEMNIAHFDCNNRCILSG